MNPDKVPASLRTLTSAFDTSLTVSNDAYLRMNASMMAAQHTGLTARADKRASAAARRHTWTWRTRRWPSSAR